MSITPARVGLALVVIAMLVAPPFFSSFMLSLVTQALIYAILAMSLDIILGYIGLASLGHAAYLGLGAYAVAILTTRHGAGFWTSLAVGVLLALAVAAVFGLIALRATGVYFLMITLALGMVVWGLAHRWVSVTQGDNGISGVPRPTGLLGLTFTDSTPFYYLALAGFGLALAVLGVVVRSPFGLTLTGVRESESRMRTLGYNVWLHKYIGFVIAGAVGGFAGVLWAYYNGFVSPADLELATSVEILLMVALGGRGTLLGPALGAAVIVLLENLVSVYTHRWLLILGAVYILTIVYAPDGIVGALRQWTRGRRARARPAPDLTGEAPSEEGGMSKKVTAMMVLAVVLLAGAPAAWAQSKAPIKIGFLAPVTGGAAQVGKDMVNGLSMWLEENGRQIGGRKVELIVEDTQGQPNVALTKLRKLVDSDKVHVLAGGLFAHVGYALAPKVDEYKVPMLYPVMAADDLTQRKPAKWVVRNGWTSSQPSHPFGEYVAKQLGYKKIVTIAIDYAFGWEVVGGFQKTFEENGGQIVQKLWPPLGTTDFAPYLSQIRRDADAVFALMVAQSSLRFPRQYQDAGLKARLPLLGGGTTFDEFVLPSLGDEAIGGISPLMYSAALDTPVNRRFVKEYRGRYKKVPSYYSEVCYTTGRWLDEAVKAIGGDVEDKEKFLAALRKVEIADAPRGPVKLDAHGNPVQNIYIRKVEKKDGELWNTVVQTYPGVSQFWKYKPEEFLKQPVYDRNFPPCKHC
jgi:branched-chain amino acid transport system substrate-binding protein